MEPIKQTTSIQWLMSQIPIGIKMQIGQELFTEAQEMDMEQKRNMFDCGRQYQLTGEGTFKEVYEEIYRNKDIG
jgi:hypothetical protein